MNMYCNFDLLINAETYALKNIPTSVFLCYYNFVPLTRHDFTFDTFKTF